MARIRVIVHFMHEHEEAAARPLMTNLASSDGVLAGEMDQADVEKLRQQGIVVQELGQRRAPLRRAATRGVRGAAATSLMDNRTPVAFTPPSPPPGAEIQYQVSIAGPMLAPWRQELQATGARILEALGDETFRVVMAPAVAALVQAKPFVTDVKAWLPDAESEGAEVMAGTPPPATAVEMITYDVLLVDENRHAEVKDWLTSRHVPIGASSKRKFRIHLLESSTLAAELQARTDLVARIEPYVPPALHNDVARTLLGLNGAAGGGAGITLEGDGQIIGVADTGIDDQHADFAGRLHSLIALGRTNDYSDPHGHGTHVTGSIAGDGAASGGRYRGVAPKARIVFQSLLDSMGRLGGLPFELQRLFEEAYQLGARIHNNSWGAATGSSYRVNSNEVDEFVYEHKDMLIVISAGNDGTAADPGLGARNAQKGFVDWLSVGSPATAKNALTIGASRSSRTSGGYAASTYGALWPQHYADNPIGSEKVSGDAEAISGFSSRGPCDDHRIKPDVVAPGTDILSCRSSKAPLRNFWGAGPSAEYAYMGGTSMAAPLVSGCAALVREYFTKTRGHQPSAALLKATLINGARWLSGASAIADFATRPNFHQGFGCIHMPDTIPHAGNAALKLEFLDDWQQPARHMAEGTRRRYLLKVAGGGELRLCLAYTDPPGRALQNNLNMLVEVPGVTKKRFGNEQIPLGFNGPDATNNVEVLRIQNAPAGDYLIQIEAVSLLKGPQDFALVATGPLQSAFLPF